MSDVQTQYLLEVDALLSNDAAEVRRWERQVFDEMAGPKAARIVLCGAGGLGRKLLAGLRQMGIEPLGFSDNNAQLWGKTVEGLTVLSPTEAVAQFGRNAVFVVAIWGAHSADRLADRKRHWRELGCETVVSFLSLFWKYAEVFLPHYTSDLPHAVFDARDRVRRAAALFKDGASRQEFVAQLRWRTELDYDGLPEPTPGLPYFPTEIIRLLDEEEFVDCGAFDGDTLADFLQVSGGTFRRVWALEPDPANLQHLHEKLAGYAPEIQRRVSVLPMAVSDRRGTLKFVASGNASSYVSSDGDIEVLADTLDTALADASPTFIKMDIEGAELDALRGADTIMKRFRPIFALSAYHRQEHLWEIPETLAARMPDYTFYLRPHDRECWDLILYAVPNERLA